MDDAETFFVGLLDVVPIGWHPGWVFILGFHCQPAPWRLESPLSIRSADQLLATAGGDRRLEQNFLALLIPEMMVGHADDDVRHVRCLGGTLVEQRLQTVTTHAELRLHLVEHAEVVVVDHSIDVALVAELSGFREQHHAQDRGDHESRDQQPDGSAAVRKNSARSHLLPQLADAARVANRWRLWKHPISEEVYLHTGAKVRHDRVEILLADAQ